MANIHPPGISKRAWKRVITARDISDAADQKPLRRFGSASVRRPVSEGIALAEAEGAQ